MYMHARQAHDWRDQPGSCPKYEKDQQPFTVTWAHFMSRIVANSVKLCALHRHQLRKSLSVDVDLNPNLSQRKDSNDFNYVNASCVNACCLRQSVGRTCCQQPGHMKEQDSRDVLSPVKDYYLCYWVLLSRRMLLNLYTNCQAVFNTM